MATYSIYVHPTLGPAAVKSGFSWPAFFFTWIWCFVKNLPVHAVGILFIGAVCGVVTAASPSLGFLMAIGGIVAVGMLGNEWVTDRLGERGFTFVDDFEADAPDGAIGLWTVFEQRKRRAAAEREAYVPDPYVSLPESPSVPILIRRDIDGRSVRPCPYCAEHVLAEATICRFCNRDLTPVDVI